MSTPSAPAVYSVVGDRYAFLLTGEQTGGACAAFDALVPPGGGSPPHVHRREDETFYVLEGEFEFDVAGVKHRVGPGGALFARRDIPHCFRNVGGTTGHMIFVAAPAGLEHFFAEVGTRLAGRTSDPIPPTPDDIARLVAAAPRYGLEIAGPPA